MEKKLIAVLTEEEGTDDVSVELELQELTVNDMLCIMQTIVNAVLQNTGHEDKQDICNAEMLKAMQKVIAKA